jgi:uncharacterized membrane protein YdfJ with MMPL/SSD domain
MLRAIADRSTRHPRRWLAVAFALVLAAAAIGGPVAGLLSSTGDFDDPGSPAIAAKDRIEGATGTQVSPGIVAAVAPAGGVASPAGRADLRAVARTLGADAAVAAATVGPVSSDGRRGYVLASLKAGADEAAAAERVDAALAGRPGVSLGGPVFVNRQISEQITTDLGRAEMLAFPLLAGLSLLFFRRWRAALLPVIVGFATILVTFFAMRVFNEAYGLSIFALNLVISLGLGLAVDYSLFLVSRFREEMAARGPGAEAVRATLQSAGRTIVFSSLTVAAAMASLIVFPLNFLKSMGIGGALVALVAAGVALTIVPALLAIGGHKLAVKDRGQAAGAEGRWYRLSRWTMRRPGVVAAVTTALMLAVTLPAVGATFKAADVTTLSTTHSARVVSDSLAADTGGDTASPLVAAVEAPAGAGPRVAAYAASLRALPGVERVQRPAYLGDGLWQVDAAASGTVASDATQALVDDVRAAPAPGSVLVGGQPADFRDSQAAIANGLPVAIGLLVLTTILVLWLMTGSVVLPIKAVLMNALTVGATLGLLVLVFQDGRFESLLGYESTGGIVASQFVLLAAIVFALSTDYGVFLLARIKEARDGGLEDREAVARGLAQTGGIVTAAAVLMAVAIGAFATSEIAFIKQIGIGVAAGVLIDAFVVRTFLVPSLMALLGRWNWWSPAWLTRLHDRAGVREAPPAPRAVAATD